MRYRASRYLSASIDALLRFALLERESDFARGQSVMALVMTAAAAVEPISVAEAKAHLRIDASDEDSLLTSLITAARMFVERTLSLALITESWSLYLDGWPRSGTIVLPIQPVQAVTAVKVYDPDDSPTTVNSETYSIDVLSEPARRCRQAPCSYRPHGCSNAFEVAFTAGFGDEATDVPAPVRHALKLLVAHWFEHREPVVLGEFPQEVPATVAGLLLPYRRVRL
jgi:uncharacterized phiE125 gp8 family phage protein